MLGNGL